MQTTLIAALASVESRHFLTPAQESACYDILIPGGYINAEGTWFLTDKGLATLRCDKMQRAYGWESAWFLTWFLAGCNGRPDMQREWAIAIIAIGT